MNIIIWVTVFIIAVPQTITPTASHPVKTLLKSKHHIAIDIAETSFDFGNVYPGKLYKHDFKLMNTSRNIISITNVKSDCGCTVTLPDKHILNPGEESVVHVEFSPPSSKTGRVSKSITLMLDAPEPDNWIELEIRAYIKTICKASPEFVYFKNLHYGEGATATVTITNEEGYRFNITEVEDSGNLLKLELSPPPTAKPTPSPAETDTAQMEGTWILTMYLDKDTPPGRIYTEVLLHTDSDLQPRIVIPVMGVVQGRVSIWPTQAYLGIVHPGEDIEKRFTIKSQDETFDLQVTRISSTLPDTIFNGKIRKNGTEFTILATFHIPITHTGRLDGTIRIETNDPFQKIIDVPVFGYTPIVPEETPTVN